MGQDLSGMGVKELQALENQLEISLRCIRTKKVNMQNTCYIYTSQVPPKRLTEEH